MGQPAARIGDMHTCPMITVLVPHVGGPIAGPCAPTVLIGGMPAARISDMCVCVGPPDVIAKGSASVLIMGMPAARMGDLTVHGGVIVVGLPTVLIGDAGAGGPVVVGSSGAAPGGSSAGGGDDGGGGGGEEPPPPENGPGDGGPRVAGPPAVPAPAASPKDKAAAEKLALAKSLTTPGGSGTQEDCDLVAKELIKLPTAMLKELKAKETKVVACRGSVTDHKAELRGVRPRGWSEGKTWDIVPGLHSPSTNEVVIAVIGHDTPAGAHIPATGEGHGSANLVLHEAAHALDHVTDPPRSGKEDFNEARTKDLSKISAYEKQVEKAGQSETYAESAARHYSGKDTETPNLKEYWSKIPKD